MTLKRALSTPRMQIEDEKNQKHGFPFEKDTPETVLVQRSAYT